MRKVWAIVATIAVLALDRSCVRAGDLSASGQSIPCGSRDAGAVSVKWGRTVWAIKHLPDGGSVLLPENDPDWKEDRR
jgi:hypothetical protein